MRSGTFAKDLAGRGHDVTWWSSTYLHYEKKYVANKFKIINLKDNFRLVLMHSRFGYKKNISLKRIKYSRDLGKIFNKESLKQKTPDIIYTSWPLIDLSYEAVNYANKHNIPVVVDIRDMWPDIFVQPFSKPLKPLIKLVVGLMYKSKTSYVMQNATNIIGVIPNALN